MTNSSKIKTIEIESANQEVAKKHLEKYHNIEFILQDANAVIDNMDENFDLIFADTFPGKVFNREKVLGSVKVGGYYIVDDLIPQVNWPDDDHPLKVKELVKALEADNRFNILKLNWASGLIVCVRKSN